LHQINLNIIGNKNLTKYSSKANAEQVLNDIMTIPNSLQIPTLEIQCWYDIKVNEPNCFILSSDQSNAILTHLHSLCIIFYGNDMIYKK